MYAFRYFFRNAYVHPVSLGAERPSFRRMRHGRAVTAFCSSKRGGCSRANQRFQILTPQTKKKVLGMRFDPRAFIFWESLKYLYHCVYSLHFLDPAGCTQPAKAVRYRPLAIPDFPISTVPGPVSPRGQAEQSKSRLSRSN